MAPPDNKQLPLPLATLAPVNHGPVAYQPLEQYRWARTGVAVGAVSTGPRRQLRTLSGITEMRGRQELSSVSERPSALRIQARASDLDRHILASRVRLAGMKWIGSPSVVLAVGYLSYFLYDRGIGLTGTVLVSIGGLAASDAGVISVYRRLREDLNELEQERVRLDTDETLQ